MRVSGLWSRLRRPPEGIVTLADDAYFPGLELLYASARESYPVPMVCFDVGITGRVGPA